MMSKNAMPGQKKTPSECRLPQLGSSHSQCSSRRHQQQDQDAYPSNNDDNKMASARRCDDVLPAI